jgi:hypothetical protein
MTVRVGSCGPTSRSSHFKFRIVHVASRYQIGTRTTAFPLSRAIEGCAGTFDAPGTRGRDHGSRAVPKTSRTSTWIVTRSDLWHCRLLPAHQHPVPSNTCLALPPEARRPGTRRTRHPLVLGRRRLGSSRACRTIPGAGKCARRRHWCPCFMGRGPSKKTRAAARARRQRIPLDMDRSSSGSAARPADSPSWRTLGRRRCVRRLLGVAT